LVEASNKRIDYDIGYVYFKLGEYPFALKAFNQFDSQNSGFDSSYQRDTFLRMGDCSFAMKSIGQPWNLIIKP